MKVVRFEDREQLILSSVKEIERGLTLTDVNPHAIMLSGGSTPLAIYDRITKSPFVVSENAFVTYSDERFVLPEHKENNYFNTKSMLNALKFDRNRVIRVKTELGFEGSVRDFNEHLTKFLQKGSVHIGFLGMGTDGHTASLFSLENVHEGKGKMAIGVRKSTPPDRISVTKEFLLRCQKIIILLTGQEKQAILKTLLESPDTIPAGVALKDHPNVEVWVSL